MHVFRSWVFHPPCFAPSENINRSIDQVAGVAAGGLLVSHRWVAPGGLAAAIYRAAAGAQSMAEALARAPRSRVLLAEGHPRTRHV